MWRLYDSEVSTRLVTACVRLEWMRVCPKGEGGQQYIDTISMAPPPFFSTDLVNSVASAKSVPGPHNPSRCMYPRFLRADAPVADTYMTRALRAATIDQKNDGESKIRVGE
jgi:hypothetical protein